MVATQIGIELVVGVEPEVVLKLGGLVDDIDRRHLLLVAGIAYWSCLAQRPRSRP